MKNIHIIEMGGTISARGTDRLDYKDYVSGELGGKDFLKEIPELFDIANISFTVYSDISSTKITTDDWNTLRQKVIELAKQPTVDGIVITHGTSTLEETAYFLHLTVPTEKPIVFVGAQRPFTALSSDAQLNLVQAVRVAASNDACHKGVLVVLNDQINCAREATKTNTYRLDTFQSGSHGLLGIIDADHTVQFYRQPLRTHTYRSEFALFDYHTLPHVEIVYSYAGANGFLIKQIVENGTYKGIVAAGTGAGLLTPSELVALEKATEKGLFIVRSSRGGGGRVVNINSYAKYPFISADDLSPQKARILLMLSLLKYDNPKKIQHIFHTY